MVNQVILDYLKANSGKYSVVELKKKIIEGGYSEGEYSEALSSLKKKNKEKVVSNEKGVSNDVKSEGIKWIFIGFIASIILTLFVFYGQIAKFLPAPNLMDDSVAILILVLLVILIISKFVVLFGFYKTGKYSKKNSLKVSSLVLIITFALMIILFGVFYVYSNDVGGMGSLLSGNVVTSTTNDISGDIFSSNVDLGSSLSSDDANNFMAGMFAAVFVMMWEAMPVFIKIVIGLGLLLGFNYVIWYFFFSIGLIKIRGDVRFGLISGILRMMVSFVSLGVMLFFIYIFIMLMNDPMSIVGLFFGMMTNQNLIDILNGVFGFIFLATYVFEMLVLFMASKRYEIK